MFKDNRNKIEVTNIKLKNKTTTKQINNTMFLPHSLGQFWSPFQIHGSNLTSAI